MTNPMHPAATASEQIEQLNGLSTAHVVARSLHVVTDLGVADLIAVRSEHNSPARVLSHLTFINVELVLLAGVVRMASPRLYERLPRDLRSGMELIGIEGHQRWIRTDLQSLFESAERILGVNKLLLGGRKLRHLGTRAARYTERTYLQSERD